MIKCLDMFIMGQKIEATDSDIEEANTEDNLLDHTD